LATEFRTAIGSIVVATLVGMVSDSLAVTRRIAYRSTPVEIAGQIRFAIHSGEIGPGDKLPPERTLAYEMGVGRITLREALAMLNREGYLVPRRGQGGGTFVTDLEVPRLRWLAEMKKNKRYLEDLIELRIAVERRSIFLAAQRRNRSDLAALRRSLRDLGNANGLMAFRQSDTAFHNAIARAARCETLRKVVEEARAEIFSPTDSYTFKPAVARTLEEHRAIYSAIEDKDGETAANLIEDHIEGTRKWLLRLVSGASRNSI
jgi:GntR family transcriptional repressor for pyruvate dehydrogenase complex